MIEGREDGEYGEKIGRVLNGRVAAADRSVRFGEKESEKESR